MQDGTTNATMTVTGDEPLRLGAELADSINYRIRLAQILAFRLFEKRLPGFGGAARYLGVLAIIRNNPGQPQHKLAEAVGLQRSSLVPILDRMEENGIVERREAEGDRRSKTVCLTAKGAAVVDELTVSALEVERRTLAGLSDADVACLIRGLDRVIENLREV